MSLTKVHVKKHHKKSKKHDHVKAAVAAGVKPVSNKK